MPLRSNAKSLIIASLLVLLFVASAVYSYLYFLLARVKAEKTQTRLLNPLISTSSLTPTPMPEMANIYNILLLGYGGPGHSGEKLTDTLMVLHLDSDKKIAALISIPRDIWIPIPSDTSAEANQKINNAYAVGGGELAKFVSGRVIGMPINFYISVNFEGFKRAIDDLGRINVDVPISFDDYYFPVKGKENETCGKSPEDINTILTTLKGFEIDKQFPCRFEHLHFDEGIQPMDGETALKFVRSRHSVQHGGDFARSVRQQALLLAIKEKLLSLGAFDDAIAFFNRLSYSITTDIDQQTLQKIIKKTGKPSDYALSTINLSEDNTLTSSTANNGQFILMPKSGNNNWESIHEYIREKLSQQE